MIKAYRGHVRTPGADKYDEVVIEEETALEERLKEQYGGRAKCSFEEVPMCKIKVSQLTAQDMINLSKMTNK